MVDADGDPNDSETRWYARGDCACCQHRSYACSLRAGRRDIHGNIITPRTSAARLRQGDDVEMEDAPAPSPSARSGPIGVLPTSSRSRNFRSARIDYQNPAERDAYVAAVEAHLAEVRAGNYQGGASSTDSSRRSSQQSFQGFSDRGSPQDVARDRADSGSSRDVARNRADSGSSRGGGYNFPTYTGTRTTFTTPTSGGYVSPPRQPEIPSNLGRGDSGRGGNRGRGEDRGRGDGRGRGRGPSRGGQNPPRGNR